jgi:hypothetical protein
VGKKKRLAGMVGEACVPSVSSPLLSARTSTGPVVAMVAHVVERMIVVEGQGRKHCRRRYPDGPWLVNRGDHFGRILPPAFPVRFTPG